MQIEGLTLELLQSAPFDGALRPAAGSGRQLFEDVLRDLQGASTDASKPAVSQETAEAAPAKHLVRTGDNLSRICKQYLLDLGLSPTARDIHVAVQKVAEANALSNKNLIIPGQQLDLTVLSASSGAPRETTAAVEDDGETPTPELPVIQQTAAPTSVTPPSPIHSPEMTEAVKALAALQPNISLWTPTILGDESEDDLHTEFQAFQPPSVEEVAAMGPFMAPEEAALPVTPSTLELERVLTMMDALIEKHKSVLAELETGSPWTQVLEQPAHLTSEFGIRRDPVSGRWQQHDGIDLAAPMGSQVYPFKEGQVIFSGWQSGYGKVVIVRHDDGLESVYGHNSQNLVHAGQRVTEKTPLSLVGSTGRSTGPHLHFEVRRDGQAVDPIPYLANEPIQLAELQ